MRIADRCEIVAPSLPGPRSEAPPDDAREAARIAALRSYGVLDTPPEVAFDDLTGLIADICDVPMALVSLVDADRQWSKSCFGSALSHVSPRWSFCRQALTGTGLLVVPDARTDVRFAESPLVMREPFIRFYAGAPLETDDGHAIGTLCVLDVVPRALTPKQLAHLALLARQVMAQLQLRRQVAQLHARPVLLRAPAIETSRSLLSGILTNTDALIYAKDLDGRFTLANEALHLALDLPIGAIVGRTDHDLLPAEIADEFRRKDIEMVCRGERQVRREQLQHPDGTSHDYLSKTFPLLDAAGRICAVAGVMTDVTELEDQRRELAESEDRWRTLVEHSPVAVAVIGPDARFAYANPEAMRLYGVTEPPSIVGHPSTEFVPPEDLESTRQLFASMFRGASIVDRRWTLRRADGRLVSVEINACAVVYRGQAAVQVELRDRTAQVAAETALRESEGRWRSLFAASPVGIGVSDEHGIFVTANLALCTLLGRPDTEVIGHHNLEFAYPDDIDGPTLGEEEPSASSPAVLQLEKRFVRPDGDVRWGSLTLTHVPGPAGEAWTLAHIEDVTDRRAAARATIDSEANLSAVAKVITQIQSGADARQTIVDATLQLAGATKVSLVEADPEQPTLRVTTTTDPDLLGMEVALERTSVTVEVYRTGRAIFLSDAATDPLAAPALVKRLGVDSIYFVPVRSGDTVTAVLVVGWDHHVSGLDDRRAGVVTLLADQAGVALRQAALLAELEGLALTDTLTGLVNRRGWDQRLTTLIAQARHTHDPLTIAIADLDHFKKFNDTYGHPAGDGLLRRFAEAGRAALRRGDTLARWGGEEFAMALPDSDAGEAEQILARVLRASPDQQTCSIGYATWEHSESAEQLMERADRALYTAKRAGRNQIAPAW